MKETCYDYKSWKIIEKKSHILKQEGNERVEIEDNLKLPMYPEMIFDQNTIEIIYNLPGHESKLNKIAFNVTDALKLVARVNNQITVASADVWQEANAHILRSELITGGSVAAGEDRTKTGAIELAHRARLNFDWTFTTGYAGSVLGTWTTSRTDFDAIDYDVLRRKEPILFYSEMSLFEDELGDNGVVQLSIRLRVMPSGWFLLQRFFLRVDGRLLRVFDTRLCCGAAVGSNEFLVREVRHKQSSRWTDAMSGVEIMEAEPLCDTVLEHYCERLTPVVTEAH